MSQSGSQPRGWDKHVDRSLLPEWFSVETDLNKLDQVLNVGAVEAAVLYAARLLDVLASAAVRLLGLTPGPNVFDNLQILEQFGLPPRTTRYWAHGLRRIGNEARHLHRRIDDDDALLARTLLERWLEWFFCRFPLGPRLDTLPAMAAGRDEGAKLRELVASLDREESTRSTPVNASDAAALLTTIVAAETLLDRADPSASEFLTLACKRFPDNPRLRQLHALGLSRSEGPEHAIAELEPLLREAPDDPETQGILAGAYKRMAQRSGEQGWMEKAHRLYAKGWSRSRGTNTYLGINAAATALFLGRPAVAREMASAVEQHLSRATHLDLASDIWAPATLAEAWLIVGELAKARSLYRRTFQIHASRVDAVLVARRQADRLLESLSMAPDPFWSISTAAEEIPNLGIGVTGHRSWMADSTLEGRVGAVLRQIQTDHPRRRWTFMTGLAEGADRLVPNIASREFDDVSWISVLPLEADDYIKDFATEASREEFRSFLARSRRVVFPRRAFDNRPSAYFDCGKRVVDESDLLIALWDGQPPRGAGGTADVVGYARTLGKPVHIIQVQR